MKIELTQKEISLISLVLHTCAILMGNSKEKNEIKEIINKLNPSST